jgi:ribosomal protein S6--L-glutamate ligase|tara:strand:+ start:49 stop:1431 length:1383 start_codon:yes stop_codon:yes gene_type:complete
MKAPKFREFISEAPENGKYKLLVVTDEPEKAKTFHTADRLKEEAEKLGWKYYLYKLTGGYTTSPEGALRLHNKDDEKGFEVSSKDTIAIIRGSVTRKDSWMDIVSLLEKHSVCVVNSRETISVCADKYRTSLRLADYGVKQPVTHLINDPENSVQAFENLNTQYPIILKTLRGSKGVGVLFVESAKALDSIVQLIHKQDEDADLLLQEYIKTDYDARVLVMGGKVLSTMKRPVIEGDFRSNVSQGSKPEKLDLTELEIEESLKAAKAVNGLWTAVDFIPSKNRTKEPPFIIEVNSSPGTEGMEEATGRNISKEILEFFSEKKNWVKVPSECGYKEIVTIKPFGEIIAKFDTGNSGMSVIHADKMSVKDKKVTWTLLGKTITSDIIRKEEISVGGLRDYDEDRYVIKLNVEFLDTMYETEFTLDDREDRTPILFDREFMSRVNVMVNPDRKYVVTTKYSLD